VVTAGAELFRMIKNNALEWRAELNEAQFLSVKLGDAVQVQTESVEVTGKVRAMDAGLQMKTRTAVIYVDLPTNSMLRAGTFAHGQIVRGQKSVLLLPSSAIIKRDGFSYVFTVADGVASQRQIQTGVNSGDQMEVLGGLENGTPVVLEGAGFLADGDRVAVIAAANAGAAP
jgi:RND family efflux transporter MFP subunit